MLTWPRRDRSLLGCAVATALVLLFVVPHRIAEDGYLNHVAGSWAALADDWAHGVLYRPLLSDLGYGGTRNFPLHIVLHGWLVRTGLSLSSAGHALNLAAAALLVAGGAVGLERRGAPRTLAWFAGLLVLASRTAVMGVAGIRGDLLPVALGVMGLALAPRHSKESVFPCGVFLALALLAKPTLAWAPAGAFFATLASRQVRSAISLTVVVSVVTALGMMAALGASHGEMLKSFKACASGGGFALDTLTTVLNYVRPGDVVWALGGVGLPLLRGRRALTNPFCTAGLACLAVTLLLLTSKGTHVNHLVDATVMGALAIASAVFEDSSATRAAQAVLLVATALGLVELMLLDGMQMRRGELAQAVAALPPGKDPVLSEQPWIPLMAGERAFSSDAYNLLQTRRTLPAVNDDLMHRIDTCGFRVVITLGRVDGSAEWYDLTQFGPGFATRLLQHYAFQGVHGAHAFYVPRCGLEATPLPVVPANQEETILARGGRPNAIRKLIKSLLSRGQ